MLFGMLRKGVSLALAGDFATLRTAGVETIRDRIPLVPRSEELPPRVTRIGEVRPPEWLSTTETPLTYRIDDETYAIGTTNGEDALEISADVAGVEVPISLPDHAAGVDVRIVDSDGGDLPLGSADLALDETFEMPTTVYASVDCESVTNPFSIAVDIEHRPDRPDPSRFVRWFDEREGEPASTRVGLPAIVPSTRRPPVVIVSVDTLRYDAREALTPLLEALGDDAVVPAEPRTQGNWTPPSHGSMFTGTHPGEHGYVGWGKGEGDERPLHPDLTTIGELLTDHGYKSSALVSHSRILPEYGFGRGFHRFRLGQQHYTTWLRREHDVRTKVDRLCRWIDADVAIREHSLFYFLHVFDPHYPYLPPRRYLDGRLDVAAAADYREAFSAVRERAGDGDYVRMATGDHDGPDDALVDTMRAHYAASVRYTADHLARLVRHLKDVGLFDDALVVVTGDHGEEFGERGFYTHTSLYDANIRPFMAIKPPRGADWTVRDEVDTIDLLPTLARLVGTDVPEHVTGVPLQEGPVDDRARLTERIRPDRYSIAVEVDGTKGIFTFEENYPDRPSERTVAGEPLLEEYYDLASVRSGEFEQMAADGDERDHLLELAREFVTSDRLFYTSERRVSISEETSEQLELLGYT
jgi:arylsulfatase A-like enzyme